MTLRVTHRSAIVRPVNLTGGVSELFLGFVDSDET